MTIVILCVKIINGAYENVPKPTFFFNKIKKAVYEMKTTGIVRNIDELGRVVIPKEIRRNLGISNNDPIEFFVDSDRIILQKFQSSCHFCGGSDKVIEYKGKKICEICLAGANALAAHQ